MLGCPVLCASGTYSGAGNTARVGGCPNTCLAGAYCPAGSILPVACPGGQYGEVIGQHLVGDACQNCPAGYFSNNAVAAPSCDSCPAGYSQHEIGKAFCLPCIPGKYQSSNTAGATSCESCATGKYQESPSESACVDCIAGKYNDELSATGCTFCIPGKYQAQEGVTMCLDCASGTYLDLSGQSMCKLCNSGQFVLSPASTTCVTCSVGKYSSSVGSTKCTNCVAGTFQSNTGQTNCADCNAGMFSTKNSATMCLNCPLAKFASTPKHQECKQCPAGLYQDVEGSLVCKACVVAGQAANDAQTTCINPSYTVKSDCKDTEYLDNADPNRDHHVCRVCPAGASCIGWVDWTEVRGIFGWSRCPARSGAKQGNDTMVVQRNQQTSTGASSIAEAVLIVRPEIFERCSFAAACLGRANKDLERRFILSSNMSRSERCNDGYVNSSRLCYACSDGYSHAGDLSGRCSKCPSQSENIGVAATAGIMGLFGLCAYLFITINDAGRHDSSDAFKMIALNFIQLLTLLTTFPIEWPPIFTYLFQVGGAITALGQHFVNLKCMFPSNTDADVFYSVVLIWSAMPVVLNLLICGVWLIAKHPALDVNNKVGDAYQKMKSCFVATLYLLYPTLCSQTFSVFACRSVCAGSSDLSSYLRADLEEPCGVGRHLFYTLAVGVPMLIVYVIGLPVVALIQVGKIRNKAVHSKRHSMKLFRRSTEVYGMLFTMFREDTWFWEISIAFRKIVFAAVGVFGGNLGEMQVHITSMFLMFVIVATAIVRPFESKTNGRYGHLLQTLEIASLVAVWLTLWSGLVFFSYPRCEAYYGADRNNEDESNDGTAPGSTLPWCDAISVVTGVMDVLVVVAVVLGLLYKMRRSKEDARIRELEEKKHGGRMSILHIGELAGVARAAKDFTGHELDHDHLSQHDMMKTKSEKTTSKYAVESYVINEGEMRDGNGEQDVVGRTESILKTIEDHYHEDEDLIKDHLVKKKEDLHEKVMRKKELAHNAKAKRMSEVTTEDVHKVDM